MTTIVPVVKKVRIAVPEVTDAEIKQPKKDKKDKGDKKDKDKKNKKRKRSPEEIATPVAEVNEAEAKDIPMADAPAIESPDQSKSSKKEGKEKKEKREKREKRDRKDKKSKKDKKDKKDKKKSKDTPAALENNPEFALAAEAVDNKKRKSAPTEDTPAKKKKEEEGKAKMSQERLVELVGDEELDLEDFLERFKTEVDDTVHEFSSVGNVFEGLQVKVDGGKVVLSLEG